MRNKNIDIMKGIGIILVVLSHTGGGHWVHGMVHGFLNYFLL